MYMYYISLDLWVFHSMMYIEVLFGQLPPVCVYCHMYMRIQLVDGNGGGFVVRCCCSRSCLHFFSSSRISICIYNLYIDLCISLCVVCVVLLPIVKIHMYVADTFCVRNPPLRQSALEC